MKQLSIEKTSSPAIKVGIGMGAFLAIGSFSTSAYTTNANSYFPYVERVTYVEETGTPEIFDMNQKSDKYQDIKELFPIVRDFTEEELIQYNKSLDKLFQPTEYNIFEL